MKTDLELSPRQMREIYDLINSARIAKGLNQTQLAELVGVSQSVVSQLESGNHLGVASWILLKMCAKLDIDPIKISRILGFVPDERSKIEKRLEGMVQQLVSLPAKDQAYVEQVVTYLVRGMRA